MKLELSNFLSAITQPSTGPVPAKAAGRATPLGQQLKQAHQGANSTAAQAEPASTSWLQRGKRMFKSSFTRTTPGNPLEKSRQPAPAPHPVHKALDRLKARITDKANGTAGTRSETAAPPVSGLDQPLYCEWKNKHMLLTNSNTQMLKMLQDAAKNDLAWQTEVTTLNANLISTPLSFADFSALNDMQRSQKLIDSKNDQKQIENLCTRMIRARVPLLPKDITSLNFIGMQFRSHITTFENTLAAAGNQVVQYPQLASQIQKLRDIDQGIAQALDQAIATTRQHILARNDLVGACINGIKDQKPNQQEFMALQQEIGQSFLSDFFDPIFVWQQSDVGYATQHQDSRLLAHADINDLLQKIDTHLKSENPQSLLHRALSQGKTQFENMGTPKTERSIADDIQNAMSQLRNITLLPGGNIQPAILREKLTQALANKMAQLHGKPGAAPAIGKNKITTKLHRSVDKLRIQMTSRDKIEQRSQLLNAGIDKLNQIDFTQADFSTQLNKALNTWLDQIQEAGEIKFYVKMCTLSEQALQSPSANTA